ncbi:hypothetical protein NDU88_006140 [Pleurodeles waltl]|uniref:Uncharacterized protein n=1 Tax=Pleurodeles waltl TaxID=8319 RepID=A0AAV7NPE0_PLEWA|nr:hypothetical protein NDU88_006140 [Pleurodeles waltl]
MSPRCNSAEKKTNGCGLGIMDIPLGLKAAGDQEPELSGLVEEQKVWIMHPPTGADDHNAVVCGSWNPTSQSTEPRKTPLDPQVVLREPAREERSRGGHPTPQ